jgi:3-mercaptopropionate dioxygenase
MTTERVMGEHGEVEQFDFPGSERLIEVVRQAVEQSDPEAVTETVKQGLCRLISGTEFSLPECFLQPEQDHYARRLVYRDPRNRFSIVAMTWGPDQGTPLHDHAGLWCVEGVCCGRIRVEQFSLRERDGDRFRFSREDVMRAERGSAGCLIPPHEYHCIFNDCGDDVAVTLHIYGGDMTACNVFKPTGEGWYERQRKPLDFDA